MMPPFITVITTNLNQRENLVKTLDCIRDLDDPELEHIVIDGLSDDGSVELLKSRSNRLLRFISEADAGIADAMNKGIERAKGRWLVFLHCSDRFVDLESYRRFKTILLNQDQYDGVIFDTVIESDGLSWIRRVRNPNHFWRKLPYCHQGTVWKRDCFSQVGLFNTKFKICMDFDWHIRAVRNGMKLALVHEALTVMDGTGVSSRTDWKGLSARFYEENRVLVENAPNRVVSFLYSIYGALYIGFRWLVRRSK